MAQLTCEICGTTNFVKEDGVFVCKTCGAKYTAEEARKSLQRLEDKEAEAAKAKADAAKAKAEADAATAAVIAEQVKEMLAPQLYRASDFAPESLSVKMLSPGQLNNYACQAFQLLMSEYEALGHPSDLDQRNLVKKAKECLVLLDNAAMAEPENHLQDLLIYENCDEIVDAVRGTATWSQDAEGNWEKTTYGVSARDLEIPGQKDSWEKKATYHRDFVEVEWLNTHESEVARRRALEEEIAGNQAEITALKQEKKGLGFVANIPLLGGLLNSDAKDLNERMKPFKQQISALNGQISEIDRAKKDYVEDQLRTAGASLTRLDF